MIPKRTSDLIFDPCSSHENHYMAFDSGFRKALAPLKGGHVILNNLVLQVAGS